MTTETGALSDREAMIDAALHARVPGGSEVWCWLPQQDAWTPHQTARDVMGCAIDAILALRPPAPDSEKIAEPSWGNADTVGNFFAQLQTIDPAQPIFAGFHVKMNDGRMLSKVRGLHMSWEHVTDGRHISGRKGEGVRTLVAWAGEPAPESGYRVEGPVYEAAVKGRQDFRLAYREVSNALALCNARLDKAFEPTEKEREAICKIGADQELSNAAVMRQALRLYQLVHERTKAGETFSFSGDAQRAAEFAGNPAPESGEVERVRETLKLCHHYWREAAKEALQGDLGRLRKHVALSDEDPEAWTIAALRTPPAGEQPVGDVGALVERLRGLLAAATKRPWRRFNSVHGNDVLAIMKGDRPTDGKWPQIITWAGFDGTDVPKRYNVANLELIVEAVNALPTLLAALSSLSAQVAGMREALEVGLQAMGTAERVDWAIRARAAIAGGEDGRG